MIERTLRQEFKECASSCLNAKSWACICFHKRNGNSCTNVTNVAKPLPKSGKVCHV